MQPLKRLCIAFIPLAVLDYGVLYGAEWTQNLFTGWAVFLVLSGVLVCVGIPMMAGEEPEKLREADVTVEPDWIRVLSRITAVTELGTVVAMGWWWTGLFYATGWVLHWFSRHLYSEAVDRLDDDDDEFSHPE